MHNVTYVMQNLNVIVLLPISNICKRPSLGPYIARPLIDGKQYLFWQYFYIFMTGQVAAHLSLVIKKENQEGKHKVPLGLNVKYLSTNLVIPYNVHQIW